MTEEEQMGGNVLWHITMSLDGFITGPDDAMEWAFEHSAPSAIADEVMETTGAILAGRRWYDVATERYEGREGIYGGAWTGPVFVLTHRPPDVHDAGITFLSDGIEAAVARARAAAEGKNVEIFGASTAQQCLDLGLLDEIIVHLAPVPSRGRRPTVWATRRGPSRPGTNRPGRFRTADRAPLPGREMTRPARPATDDFPGARRSLVWMPKPRSEAKR